MSTITKTKKSAYTLTGLAILAALTVVLQILTTYIHFGPFSITLALIPIVIGSAMFGIGAGAFLGAMFSIVVVLMCIFGADPGGAIIWNANPFLCAAVCMLKGTAAGLMAGVMYSLIKDLNQTLAVVAAAFISPIVNTGIFVLFMLLFFRDILTSWAGGSDLVFYIIFTLTGVNFLIELGVNMILSPVILRIIKAVQKTIR